MQAVDGEWSMRGRRLRPCCAVSAACARWLLQGYWQRRRTAWHKAKALAQGQEDKTAACEHPGRS